MEINGITVDKYRRHPRVLEIRTVLVFNNLRKSYDYDTAMSFIKALCDIFKINFNFLSTIISNEYNIRRLSKTDKPLWYQDVVFACHLYGETRWFVAQNYLDINKHSLYRTDYGLNVEKYIEQDWLDGLNDRIEICGVPHIRVEAERFLEGLEHFYEVIGNVSVTKV